MLRRTTSALAINLVVGLGLVAVAAAQEGTADAGLQEVVLAFMGRTQEDFLVGAILEEAEDYIPLHPSARVIGSVALGESSVSAVVDVELAPSAARSWLDRAYEDDGWKRHSDEPELEGFMPSSWEQSTAFCRDDFMARVEVGKRGDGSRLEYLVWGGRQGVCDRLEMQSGRRFEWFKFPALEAPEGAELRGGSDSWAGAGQSTGASLVSDLGAQDVLRHYSAQLEEIGWESMASCRDGPIGVQLWNIDDKAGRGRGGVLLVYRIGEMTAVNLGVLESPVSR